MGLADLALHEGDHAGAISLFEEVSSSEVDRFFQAQASIGRGKSLLASGDSGQAADQFESVLRDFQDHPEFTSMAQSALNGMGL